MIIPAVAFIETALETLKTRDALVIEGEVKEFRSLGRRLQRMALPENVSNPEQITDAERGYLIGLETARALLAGMPTAVMAGVEL
jgi:hypothetical protein